MQKVTKIQSGDRILNQVQDNISRVVDQIGGVAILDGVPLTGVVLKSGSNKIVHKLGRLPQGWFTTDLNAAATIYRTAWDTVTITLVASAAVTVNLWVF